MPLKLASFEHQETQEFLHLQVNLPYKSKDLDVYISDVYLKINSSPFLFEADLYGSVDVPQCKVVINGPLITFHLVKEQKGLWPSILYDGSDVKTRRSCSIERESQRQQQTAKEKKERKNAEQREQVRRQIQVEREKRERVEELKRQEQESSSNAIKEWAQQTLETERKKLGPVDSGIFAESELHKGSDLQSSLTDDLDALEMAQNGNENSNSHLNSHSQEDLSDDDINVDEIRQRVRQMLGKNKQQLPPPRERTTINVEFTSRNNIPTNTARETEDAKWRVRMKLAAAMQHKLNGEQQQQVQGLMDRAGAFYQNGDYESAINAYTRVIELDALEYRAISNRAACWLHLSKHQTCIQDCTAALKILETEQQILEKEIKRSDGQEQARVRMQVKLYLRRATCLHEVGEEAKAEQDATRAKYLDPEIAIDC